MSAITHGRVHRKRATSTKVCTAIGTSTLFFNSDLKCDCSLLNHNFTGQTAGRFDNTSPVPNASGRTDVEGVSCWLMEVLHLFTPPKNCSCLILVSPRNTHIVLLLGKRSDS